MAYSYSNTMTFVSMSTYLLILITQDVSSISIAITYLLTYLGTSILILVANRWDTQILPNLDDFTLHSCASWMNFRRKQRFVPSKLVKNRTWTQRLELPSFFSQSSSQNWPEHLTASNYEGMATTSLFVSLHRDKICQFLLGLPPSRL